MIQIYSLSVMVDVKKKKKTRERNLFFHLEKNSITYEQENHNFKHQTQKGLLIIMYSYIQSS